MTSILISGGTGFLGGHISKYLLDDPLFTRVAILSRDWHKQNALRSELGNPEHFRWFIGDVRDRDRLKRAFDGIDYIIHAAAIKDVVSSEYNPRETMLTNVIGTQNVIDAAIDCGVRRVITISSDKGCLPLSCYGKTKALAESLTIAANSYSPRITKFSVARYGNVTASSSSVIPLFRKQSVSGVLTITDLDMTRFWLSPRQAVDFIFQCLDKMVGGEIFVPHLPSSKIVDLALAISPQAKIEVIGTRPGEKKHEVMVSSDEASHTRDYGWAYVVEPQFPFWNREFRSGGSPVPADWAYSSASAQRLSRDNIKVMLDDTE